MRIIIELKVFSVLCLVVLYYFFVDFDYKVLLLNEFYIILGYYMSEFEVFYEWCKISYYKGEVKLDENVNLDDFLVEIIVEYLELFYNYFKIKVYKGRIEIE